MLLSVLERRADLCEFLAALPVEELNADEIVLDECDLLDAFVELLDELVSLEAHVAIDDGGSLLQLIHLHLRRLDPLLLQLRPVRRSRLQLLDRACQARTAVRRRFYSTF